MSAEREQRFAVVFRAHRVAVWRYVARRVLPDAVDDVVAETFLVAWRRFDELPRDPLPWLFGTARKCLANHRRAAIRGEALRARLRAEGAPPVPDPGAGAEDREALIVAFAQLSEAERELLMLTEWDGLPPRRAAAVLGIGAGTARARIHRARKKLRTALAGELGLSLDPVRSAHEAS
jgi:RNA polymerase sigma-70 factor (ECF subfamily)